MEKTRYQQDADPARLAAISEFAALRIQFDASGELNARELYEVAAITVERSDTSREDGLTAVEKLFRERFSREIFDLVTRWVHDPRLDADFQERVAQMRSWKAASSARATARAQQFMDMYLDLPADGQG